MFQIALKMLPCYECFFSKYFLHLLLERWAESVLEPFACYWRDFKDSFAEKQRKKRLKGQYHRDFARVYKKPIVAFT